MILILICVLSFVFRGFNYGVEFEGGAQFQIHGQRQLDHDRRGRHTRSPTPASTPAEAPQVVGSGATAQIVVKTESLTAARGRTLQASVAKALAHRPQRRSSTSIGSSSWGHDITVKALEGLIVFLIAVSIYISLRFQWRMAVGGIVALLHDLLIAAGIYSIVGFEVTPSTVVGLLTILGFSLYDTVVVYDKVAENSKDILAGSRTTFSEAANLAVNQTLMRSINTSLIALLPVAGLLFVGAGLLGVGTIKDLALILFVGLASGAYSSLFLATPIVVDLTEREPAVQGADQAGRRPSGPARRASAAEAPSSTGAASLDRPTRRGGGPAPGAAGRRPARAAASARR